jgi:hypothetical protein
MYEQKHIVGLAQVKDKHVVRIEILGYEYQIVREELAQLLHGYRKKISVYERR